MKSASSTETLDCDVDTIEDKEDVGFAEKIKEYVSTVYQKITNKEEYKIDQLECDEETKEELKKQNELIENINDQIKDIEGQIKVQQNIINSSQQATLSVNDPNYNIAGSGYSYNDVKNATDTLSSLNEQLASLKQYKMTVCSYYYQNYHLAELEPYDNLQLSDAYKNYTLNEQIETEVKELVGKDFSYLTDEQYKTLNYLYQTEGKGEAKEYYKLLESDLNNAKGMEEAYDMLAKLTVNIDEEYINTASQEYGIDASYLQGLTFTDLMDTQKFMENLKQKYPNLTDEELSELVSSMQKNAKVDEFSKETIANYLGVSVKGLGDGIQTFASGLINCFDDGRIMSQNEYASQYMLTALASVDTHLDDAYQISTSIGNMIVPSVVAMAATVTTNGLGAGASAEMIGSLASKILFFSSTFGNAKHEKLVAGSDKKTALQSAFLSATSEVCLESVLGTIPGLGNSNSPLKNLINFNKLGKLGKPLNALKDFIADGISEGIEEGIQEYISTGVEAYLYGTEINWDELNENARKSFIYGCLTSYIMNGTQRSITLTMDGVKKIIPVSKIQEAMSEDGNIDNEKLKSMVQEQSDNDSIEVLDSIDPSKSYFSEDINNKTKNSQEFSNYLEELRNLTNENIPSEFSSIEEYKSTFVKELIESGSLEQLNPGDIYELTKDPVMFKELIGTEKLNNLFIKNMGNANVSKLLVASLKNLDSATFNSFFSETAMNDFINNMSDADFSRFLLSFDSNMNCFFSENIVNRLGKMDINNFYNILDQRSFSWGLDNALKTINNNSAYENLLNIINSKFYNENLSSNLEYSNLIKNILPNMDCNFEGINNLIHKIENNRYSMNRKIIDSILKNTDIQMKDYGSQLVIPAEKGTYYNLVYEIDGETKTKEFKTLFSNDITLSNLLENNEFSNAALEGKLKIKGLEKNNLKTSLYLTESNGISEGINQINLIVDGKPHSIVQKVSFSKSINLNNIFTPKNSVVIDGIKSIASFNTTVDSDGVYSIQYIKNGKTVNRFISSQNQILDIDGLILRYNLTDFENPNITKLSAENIRENQININEFSASKDIYNSNKYGGNQSDIPSLLNNKFSNIDMSSIDSNKANDLDFIINKYFPNASEMEKINLAEKYANGGCCYMAVANAFATYMGSIENGNAIFKEKFGYDLSYKDGDITSYNVESLALEMCLKYYSQETKGDVNGFITQSSVGVSAATFDDKIVTFFKEHGIGIDTSNAGELINGANDEDLLTITLNHQDYFNILLSNHFDLEQLANVELKNSKDAALTNAQSNGNFIKDIGAHAMLITDFDANFEPIVSSWSNKYRFVNNSIVKNKSKGAFSNIISIKFSVN